MTSASSRARRVITSFIAAPVYECVERSRARLLLAVVIELDGRRELLASRLRDERLRGGEARDVVDVHPEAAATVTGDDGLEPGLPCARANLVRLRVGVRVPEDD